MSNEAVRRFTDKIPQQAEYGNMRLEIRDQALCVDGSDEWTHLPAQEYQILWYLTKAQGGFVQTAHLAAWLNENSQLENNKSPDYIGIVKTLIKNLRGKMKEMSSLRVRIPVEDGRSGYRLETF